MGNDNNNNENNNSEVNTTSLHNLCFFIIIVLLCAILYFTVKTNWMMENPVNTGSLQHYDSLYNNREWHISIDQAGNITGYDAPDGTHYVFKKPLTPSEFHNK